MYRYEQRKQCVGAKRQKRGQRGRKESNELVDERAKPIIKAIPGFKSIIFRWSRFGPPPSQVGN
jgi:hypothetical protein